MSLYQLNAFLTRAPGDTGLCQTVVKAATADDVAQITASTARRWEGSP